MFKFFESIAGLITTIIDFVVNAVTSLIVVLVRCVQALAYMITVITLLPAYVKVYILAMLGVSVILFVINKGSD